MLQKYYLLFISMDTATDTKSTENYSIEQVLNYKALVFNTVRTNVLLMKKQKWFNRFLIIRVKVFAGRPIVILKTTTKKVALTQLVNGNL